MQVDFYHLTTTPLDRVLPQIAEKVLASGARLLIVAEAETQRVAIDRLLWTYAREGFLPHAQAGDGTEAAQPILIAPDCEPANGARHVAIIDGRWRDAVLGYDRAFHIFDDDAIGEARTAWKALGSHADVERRYWKQTGTGRWEQAA